MILALDLGTTTGWAHYDAQRQTIASGTACFQKGRFEGGGIRFLKFQAWLKKQLKPDVIYYEEVRRHKATDAAHVYGGLLAVLTAWCEDNAIPYTGVPVGTIKKFATGKGNASKQDMINAAKLEGIDPVDDNEADAYWILEYAINDLNLET